MINWSNKIPEVCTYGTAADYCQLPDADQRCHGVAPLDSLPASWWNAMWHDNNNALNCSRAFVNNIGQELCNIIVCRGGSLNANCNNQLYSTIFAVGNASKVGMVKSTATTAGAVAIDANGGMAVNGWSTLSTNVSNLQTCVGNLSGCDTCLRTDICALQTCVGTAALETTAQTLAAAINEVRCDLCNYNPVCYSTDNPTALGTASPGTATTVARSDHVHPISCCICSSYAYIYTRQGGTTTHPSGGNLLCVCGNCGANMLYANGIWGVNTLAACGCCGTNCMEVEGAYGCNLLRACGCLGRNWLYSTGCRGRNLMEVEGASGFNQLCACGCCGYNQLYATGCCGYNQLCATGDCGYNKMYAVKYNSMCVSGTFGYNSLYAYGCCGCNSIRAEGEYGTNTFCAYGNTSIRSGRCSYICAYGRNAIESDSCNIVIANSENGCNVITADGICSRNQLCATGACSHNHMYARGAQGYNCIQAVNYNHIQSTCNCIEAPTGFYSSNVILADVNNMCTTGASGFNTLQATGECSFNNINSSGTCGYNLIGTSGECGYNCIIARGTDGHNCIYASGTSGYNDITAVANNCLTGACNILCANGTGLCACNILCGTCNYLAASGWNTLAACCANSINRIYACGAASSNCMVAAGDGRTNVIMVTGTKDTSRNIICACGACGNNQILASGLCGCNCICSAYYNEICGPVSRIYADNFAINESAASPDRTDDQWFDVCYHAGGSMATPDRTFQIRGTSTCTCTALLLNTFAVKCDCISTTAPTINITSGERIVRTGWAPSVNLMAYRGSNGSYTNADKKSCLSLGIGPTVAAPGEIQCACCLSSWMVYEGNCATFNVGRNYGVSPASSAHVFSVDLDVNAACYGSATCTEAPCMEIRNGVLDAIPVLHCIETCYNQVTGTTTCWRMMVRDNGLSSCYGCGAVQAKKYIFTAQGLFALSTTWSGTSCCLTSSSQPAAGYLKGILVYAE